MADTSQRPLELDDFKRYGRQMVLEKFGLSAQLKLQNASVVVVGAGGLGCPALLYLAAAGVGTIGIIDHDIVELSNLQRQILHNEQTVGMYKTDSAAQAIRQMNSKIEVNAITEPLLPCNALTLLKNYDIILDCTDNAPTRYLLSDTAVQLGKPLVSGGAEQYSGQVCIYNFGDNGPCYRCRYPVPASPAGGCQQTGILGVVTGIIGNLQALQTIKIITGLHDAEPTMIIFSALSFPPFHTFKLNPKSPTCAACGNEGERIGKIQDIDYVQWCGRMPDWVQSGLMSGDNGHRITVQDFKCILDDDREDELNIIDVRPSIEFGICKLPRSINVPLSDLLSNPQSYLPTNAKVKTYVLCRLGNDSQVAAEALRGISRKLIRDNNSGMVISDVIGGLRMWTKIVDPWFPEY